MNTDAAKHAGGRPKGVKGQRLNCLFKRCPCARRRHSECRHSWYYAIGYGGRGFRGTLTKYFALPRFEQVSRSSAEALLDQLWVEIRAGEYRPRRVAGSSAPNAGPSAPATFRDIGAVYVKEF